MTFDFQTNITGLLVKIFTSLITVIINYSSGLCL